jgi:YidC/Oxa1 family membrane protein insertase
MPVFISLFYMLRKDLRHDICPAINPPQVSNPKPCGASDASQFFFINDITNVAHGGVLITLIVLYVGSQLLSSVLMSVTADRNQRFIMIALPFVFVPFIQGFPAGLIVYWITTNVWTIGQQLVVKKLYPKPEPRDPDAAEAAKPARGKPPAEVAAATDGSDGAAAKKKRRQPAAKAAKADGNGSGAKPPPSPRKKKKRSGRRR